MGLTTQTWYDDRIPIAADDYRQQATPKTSATIPHAVASLNPSLMTDYVCRIRDKPLNRAVDTLVPYLRPNRQRQAWIFLSKSDCDAVAGLTEFLHDCL